MQRVSIDNVIAEAQAAFAADDLTKALQLYTPLLQAIPDNPDLLHNIASVLRRQRRLPAAQALYRRALAIRPRLQTIALLGNSLRLAGQAQAALAAHQQALAQAPFSYNEHWQLALDYQVLGRPERAVEAMQQVLRLQPNNPRAQLDLGMMLLSAGAWVDGWRYYRARHHLPQFKVNTTAPEWRGENLRGKRLLVLTEQGYGDTIHFIRFMPQLTAMGATVIVTYREALEGLLQNSIQVEAWVKENDPFPPHDYYVWLADVVPLLHPQAMPTTTAPYLRSGLTTHPALDKIFKREPRAKIGLVWAGNPEHTKDYSRSLPFNKMASVLAVPHIRFYSLQLGAAREALLQSPLRALVEDLSPHLQSFRDTAYALEKLDLLITVDTAAAHLAGALGRPVWVVMPEAADWRWLSHRSDTPWYPAMTLFRQSVPAQWDDVMAKVVTQLAASLKPQGTS